MPWQLFDQLMALCSLRRVTAYPDTQNAIKQLQIGKAPGPDGIPPEIFKVSGGSMAVKLS